MNLPSSDLVKKVDYCGVRSGKKNDKITEMGFTLKEGLNISTPYIDECPINIECKVTNILPLGTHDMFIAEVVGSHVNEDLLDEKGKIHFENANMMAYCHGEYFPLSKKPIGSFGFSVMKKKTKTRRRKLNESKAHENKS